MKVSGEIAHWRKMRRLNEIKKRSSKRNEKRKL